MEHEKVLKKGLAPGTFIGSSALTSVFSDKKKPGEKYGIQWAEGYHYMSDIPFDNHVPDAFSPVEEYIGKNVIPI